MGLSYLDLESLEPLVQGWVLLLRDQTTKISMKIECIKLQLGHTLIICCDIG